MYKQFLKILQKSDDIYLFFLCENMSFNLGMNSTDTLVFRVNPTWSNPLIKCHIILDFYLSIPAVTVHIVTST